MKEKSAKLRDEEGDRESKEMEMKVNQSEEVEVGVN